MHLIPNKIAFSKSKLNDAAVFLTLYQLGTNRTISRKRISEETGISERSIRNAIDLLREHGMVEVDSWGVRITGYGRSLLDGMGVELVDLDLSQCIAEKCIQCVVVRGAASGLDDGRDQRTAAKEKGCGSCSIWTISDGRLMMIPGWDIDLNDPVLAGDIRLGTGLSEGDVLIATGGGDPLEVREGAVEAALSLLRPGCVRMPETSSIGKYQ